MSHHVYTTKGIVLSTTPAKESDKLVAILTQDLGLVYATARGARNISSKLLAPLQDLALIRISLVKGRSAWRVTTVTLLKDVAAELRSHRKSLLALFRIKSLLKKLIKGEDRNIPLYKDVERLTTLLLQEVDEEDVDAWELLTVAKILFHLGYLSEESLPSNIIETREKRSKIISLVNSGIHASGLS